MIVVIRYTVMLKINLWNGTVARPSGKIVVVTGAFAGLGWEFCSDLAKCGWRIIASTRRTNRLNENNNIW